MKPGHHMGNRCGYTRMPDGRIKPAPTYADEFERLNEQTFGINNMLKMVSSTAADMLTEVRRRQKEVWDRLCEDYGLDKEACDITYDGYYVTVTPRESKPASTAPMDPPK